jgi:hypothetical protein
MQSNVGVIVSECLRFKKSFDSMSSSDREGRTGRHFIVESGSLAVVIETHGSGDHVTIDVLTYDQNFDPVIVSNLIHPAHPYGSCKELSYYLEPLDEELAS